MYLNMPTPPPYTPDTVDQTVEYGGATWKGQPNGGGWKIQSYGGGGGPSIDPIAEARKLLEFQREANLPAIASLQAQKQETAQRFETEGTRLEGQREPLKQRYQGILDELTRRETVDVSAQERVKSREFGRRGIPLSSGLFDVERQEAVSPIRQFYTGQTKETSLAREQGLGNIEALIASLPQQSQAMQREISNAIGALQSGDPNAALQGAITLKNLAQQQAQFEQQQALAREQMEQDISYRDKTLAFQQQQASQPNTQLVNIGGRAKLINATTGAVVADVGPWGSPGTGSGGTAAERLTSSRQELLDASASGNYTVKSLMKQFGAKFDPMEILELYTSVSPHGPPNEPEFRRMMGIEGTGGMSYGNL